MVRRDKSSTVTYTPLDSFSFQSVPRYLNKYKNLYKTIIKVKTLFQQNHFLNETDFYEDDDPVTKGIPQQHSQSPQPPHAIRPLFSEIQY